jgi:hypothetical protein
MIIMFFVAVGLLIGHSGAVQVGDPPTYPEEQLPLNTRAGTRDII